MKNYVYYHTPTRSYLKEEKYNSQLYEGKVTWLCGDFSVFKDGRQF